MSHKATYVIIIYVFVFVRGDCGVCTKRDMENLRKIKIKSVKKII